jgi:hypothetical protein
MTEQLSCASAATGPGRSQLFPGYLLTPFGWAATPLALIVSAHPTLLADLFGMSRQRMHLIALTLAHLEAPWSSDVASLLIRGSSPRVLQHVLGRFPAGIKRALKHLPTQVLRKQNYRLLIHLLDDLEAAKVLNHADQINDTAIRVLADLPQKLRKPLAFALADWPRKLNGLTDSLQFLVSHGVGSNIDELVAELATVTAEPQLAGMVEFWVSLLPLPETMPPATVGNGRRLDRVGTVCSLAGWWRNCLASYGSAIDAGHCAVYLWEDAARPAACLTRRHGRLGWFLDEVKGPRNVEIEPDQLEVITAAFADVGAPSSQVVRAIENITYGNSGALHPMDEDW